MNNVFYEKCFLMSCIDDELSQLLFFSSAAWRNPVKVLPEALVVRGLSSFNWTFGIALRLVKDKIYSLDYLLSL